MRVTLMYIYFTLTSTLSYAAPKISEKIVGGSVTEISNWPFASSLLFSWNLATYSHACGGTIITKNAILSAAHCFASDMLVRWRARVGSTFANTGGEVHKLRSIILHKEYNDVNLDNDIAILRTTKNFTYNIEVQAALIVGASYELGDDKIVWAIGWGATYFGGTRSDQLRHVQIWSVSQEICKSRYAELGLVITDNMLCSGWLDVGGRDQCVGDSGGPLIHNDIVVGVCSWGYGCGSPRFPGVNTRVSRFTSWINHIAVL